MQKMRKVYLSQAKEKMLLLRLWRHKKAQTLQLDGQETRQEVEVMPEPDIQKLKDLYQASIQSGEIKAAEFFVSKLEEQ